MTMVLYGVILPDLLVMCCRNLW